MADYVWPVKDGNRPIGTRITDVVDGDTVNALVVEDCAFGRQLVSRVRLRLARINAAKGPTGTGTAATRYLKDLIAYDSGNVRTLTTLKPYKYGGPGGDYSGVVPGGPKDYGGEYMVEIVLQDGTNVSDALVAAGHAVHWDGRGARPADGDSSSVAA
jgi:endonuclease YncB( thermonuclease family)